MSLTHCANNIVRYIKSHKIWWITTRRSKGSFNSLGWWMLHTCLERLICRHKHESCLWHKWFMSDIYYYYYLNFVNSRFYYSLILSVNAELIDVYVSYENYFAIDKPFLFGGINLPLCSSVNNHSWPDFKIVLHVYIAKFTLWIAFFIVSIL